MADQATPDRVGDSRGPRFSCLNNLKFPGGLTLPKSITLTIRSTCCTSDPTVVSTSGNTSGLDLSRS